MQRNSFLAQWYQLEKHQNQPITMNTQPKTVNSQVTNLAVKSFMHLKTIRLVRKRPLHKIHATVNSFVTIDNIHMTCHKRCEDDTSMLMS